MDTCTYHYTVPVSVKQRLHRILPEHRGGVTYARFVFQDFGVLQKADGNKEHLGRGIGEPQPVWAP